MTNHKVIIVLMHIRFYCLKVSPYEKLVSPKIPTKIFLDFCPEIFCSFLGASWKLFGLPWDLISNIINKEAYRKPKKASRKPPGSYKKFQGRNPEIILLVFWDKLIFHKDIIKSTDWPLPFLIFPPLPVH